MKTEPEAEVLLHSVSKTPPNQPQQHPTFTVVDSVLLKRIVSHVSLFIDDQFFSFHVGELVRAQEIDHTHRGA